jgi:hypothetical protein
MGTCSLCGKSAGVFRREHKECRQRHEDAAARTSPVFTVGPSMTRSSTQLTKDSERHSTSENTSFQIVEFMMLLVDALNRLGVFAKVDFRVPGAPSPISDVYIASPVRAFVEIKYFRSLSTAEVQRLIQQMEQRRRQFGEEIVPILIAIGETLDSPSPTQVLRDAGFFVLSLEISTPARSSASRCAEEIHNNLMNRSYRFEGITLGDDAKRLEASMAHSQPSVSAATKRQSSKAAASRPSAQRSESPDSPLVFPMDDVSFPSVQIEIALKYHLPRHNNNNNNNNSAPSIFSLTCWYR